MKSTTISSVAYVLILSAVVFWSASCGSAETEKQPTPEPEQEFPVLTADQLEGRIHAPDFPAGLEWLNSANPISIEHLRGKIVLLSFWTFSSINCMHVMPDLKKLEDKYARELVVLGVHSARFTNEKDAAAIRDAILRHEVKHPVVNDTGLQIWQQYGIKTWPSFAIINPVGRVVGMHSGEDVYDLFDNVIGQVVAHFDSSGNLTHSAVAFGSEALTQEQSLLKYPGKIIADPAGRRLFISDSNRNRVIATGIDGRIDFVIGSGIQGNQDGSFAEARLNRPQGLALADDILYIADTENHRIRAANLKSKKVSTVLGTGLRARESNAAASATEVALNSPWDLTLVDEMLYIAMAGSHQIWIADTDSWEAHPFAGSGQEARIDGPLLQSALAQPSGIAGDGSKLYFADSETGSIRAANLEVAGRVSTIVGTDLFDHGDVDGDSATARLQHPQGVFYYDGLIYVADTYNHKIKLVDPVRRTATTLIGNGMRGFKDGSFSEAEFNEPSGLVMIGNRLYIADCNNHQIRVADLHTRTVSTLRFSDLAPVAERTMDTFAGREIKLQPNKVRPGAARISIGLSLPEGYNLYDLAPFYVDFKSSNEDAAELTAAPADIRLNRSTGEFEIPVIAGEGEATITLEVVVYLRKSDSQACLYDMIRLQIPVVSDPKGSSMFGVNIPIRTQPRL